jgi:DNA-binding MarR family transcriptional regulator
MTVIYGRQQFGQLNAAPPRETAHDFARRLLLLRKWEKDNIPLLSPQIALDILLYSAASIGDGGPSSAKEFHLVIGHSKDRVREIMRDLIEQGLLRDMPDARDARVRRIVPTEAGLHLIDEYRNSLVRKLGALEKHVLG